MEGLSECYHWIKEYGNKTITVIEIVSISNSCSFKWKSLFTKGYTSGLEWKVMEGSNATYKVLFNALVENDYWKDAIIVCNQLKFSNIPNPTGV